MTSVRYVEAGLDDPDRQIALRITNYVGELPLKRAVAIYALALGMSLRGIGHDNQVASLAAIQWSCLLTWDRERAAGEDGPGHACPACLGAGTTKADGSPIRHEHVPPDAQRPCSACGGTGRGRAA